jgi:hypothetical protein
MLDLRFIDPGQDAALHAFRQLVNEGHRRFFLYRNPELAQAIAGQAKDLGVTVEIEDHLPDSIAAADTDAGGHDAQRPPCHFILDTNPATLSEALLKFVDLKRGTIIAPVTGRHFSRNFLFLISIPKSGTHLLYELARAFGYSDGIICPDNPAPGHWYCLEYSNSHTVARDFFVDTVRRSPFGNRHHPFANSPALFIYRNPLDIVVSEANYYHRDGNAAFGNYLAESSFEERLLRLIDDPWLLGSIRDRIGGFLPWLSFCNVVPLSFEELIGADGSGDSNAQTRLVWSLQLKLHVPGNPAEYGKKVFNRESATFQSGQIGTYARRFTPEAAKKFGALNQDFMRELGYPEVAPDGRLPPAGIPMLAEKFLKRPLLVQDLSFDDTPIAYEFGFLGFNIIRFKRRFYALPQGVAVDLAALDDQGLSRLISAPDLNATKQAAASFSGLRNLLPSPLEKTLRKLGRWWWRGQR